MKLHKALLYSLVLALLLYATGCSSLWGSIKSAAAPAAGGAAGAAVGSLAGPVGTIVGAAGGAVVGDSLEENASLRSGETVGSEALERQVLIWKGRAVEASSAATFAEEARSGLKGLMYMASAAFGCWFIFRNRHNIRERGFVSGLIHAVMGGNFGGIK